MSAPKQQALIRDEEPSGALQPVTPITDGYNTLIERLATDPRVDVDKLERLMAMQQAMKQQIAKAAFDAAMSAAQAEMRRVATDSNNPQTRSRYASYGALDRALRPIYTGHGFGLSFNTGDGAPAEFVRILCEVTHRDGYSKSYHIDMPADGKGAKGGDVMTKTHAVGSAASYGMRYLLKMIFNVAVGEDDDDGNGASGKGKPEVIEPKGFAEWSDSMTAAADEGVEKFRAAWTASNAALKAFAQQHRAALIDGWKKRATDADRRQPRG